MKNYITTAFVFIYCFSFGQVSDNFSYQGLLLDSDGFEMSEKLVDFTISISSDELGIDKYFEETQSVSTDDNGVFDLMIGNGQSVFGTIEQVDWLQSVPYITISYDLKNGQGLRDLGTTQFSAVPFCLYSKFVVCQDGRPGEDGEDGPTGATGATGPPAPTPAYGPVGPQGAKGAEGNPIMTMMEEPPQSNTEGKIYLDDGTNREDSLPGFRYFDGTSWLDL